MGNIQREDYENSSNPRSKNQNWMSLLSDGKKLSELSIPGTNHSMNTDPGAVFQCQSWSLKLQYEAGIRFVDIGLKQYRTKLSMLPGTSNQSLFHSILTDTFDFLQKNTRETILMHVYEEYYSSDKKPKFYIVVNQYIREAGLTRFWTSTAVPTLGQVRGKIVILQDFDGPEIGIPYKNLKIADDRHVATLFDVGWKWSKVLRNLTDAQSGNSNTLYLTYSAGASMGAYPYSVARNINYEVLKFLRTKGKGSRWGIIAMDFPGSGLVQSIISFN